LECDSTKLDVTFKPVLSLQNNTKNSLSVNWWDSEIRVVCEDCGADLEMEPEWDGDVRLEGLAKGLGKAIGLADKTVATIDEDGVIGCEKYNIETTFIQTQAA